MPFLGRGRSKNEPPWSDATRKAIERGWNGLPWGATIADFRAKFPDATRTDSGWMVTGRGQESFCGVLMTTQYGLNGRDELYMVSFIPAMEDRERLSAAVVNELGTPRGSALSWRVGDIDVEVKVAGVVALLTHRKLARR